MSKDDIRKQQIAVYSTCKNEMPSMFCIARNTEENMLYVLRMNIDKRTTFCLNTYL